MVKWSIMLLVFLMCVYWDVVGASSFFLSSSHKITGLGSPHYLYNSNQLPHGYQDDAMAGEGSTLVAIKYGRGVVVACDSHENRGIYVNHRFADKWIPISVPDSAQVTTTNDDDFGRYSTLNQSTVFVGRSGSQAMAAIVLNLVQNVQGEMEQHYYRYGGRVWTVSEIAGRLRTLAAEAKLNTGGTILIVGHDPYTKRARIFSLLLPTGVLLEEGQNHHYAFAVAGSGSNFILGLLQSEMRHRRIGKEQLTQPPLVQKSDNQCLSSNDDDEMWAIDLCRRAARIAIQRDAHSGGDIRIKVMDGCGIREIQPSFSTTDCQHQQQPGLVNHGETAIMGRVRQQGTADKTPVPSLTGRQSTELPGFAPAQR